MTAAYVGKVRDTRFLTPHVAIPRAVLGMVPEGQTDINPASNAIQSLITGNLMVNVARNDWSDVTLCWPNLLTFRSSDATMVIMTSVVIITTIETYT